jgi:type IV secretion system protein VirB4
VSETTFRRSLPYLGDRIPLEEHLTDRTIRLSDDGVFAMFEADGLGMSTADGPAFAAQHDRLNGALLNMPSTDRVIFSVYLCRGPADEDAIPAPDDRLAPFARDFLSAYRANLLDNGMLYENRLFIGVQLRPGGNGEEFWSIRKSRQGAPTGERAIDRARSLERICDWLMSELSEYGLRPLGVVERDRQMFSEIAEAIALAMTSVWRAVPITTGRIGDAMFCEDVTFHHETIEFRGPGQTMFSAHLGLREYMASTWPGMLAAIECAPFSGTLHQSLEPLPRSMGTTVLTRKQNKMVWAQDRARSQIAELDQAADHVASGKMHMGIHNLTLAVFASRSGAPAPWYRRFRSDLSRAGLGAVVTNQVEDLLDAVTGGPTSNPLQAVANAAFKTLSGCGATVARESKALMASWLAMAPGNQKLRPRPGACSTRNFAALSPLHGQPRGPARSRWGAEIATFRTLSGTPYRFHWHDGEGDDAVGNTLITGETGSGKTTFVGAMIAATAGRADVIGLDHKQGWRVLAGHLGAPYTVMGDGNPLFAPLKALDPTEADIGFLVELLRGCIMQGGWRDLSPEEDRLLSLAVRTVMENPPEARHLAEVAAFFSPDTDTEGAGARLLKWCWGGELGWVIDAPRDALTLTDGSSFLDTTAVLSNPRAAAPSLLCLFHRINRRLDGQRQLLLPVDEGWRVLEDPAFYQPIAAQLRTIRSKNGVVVFITQSPADAADSPIASELLEQCPNQIHLPNSRALERHYVERLRRTPGEYEALRSLQKGSGMFLLCKGRDSLICDLPLRGLPQLAALSASSSALQAYEAIPEDVRLDPRRLQGEFMRRRADEMKGAER